MAKRLSFNPARFWAIVVKEFIQMRRDRLTFGMMIGIPLLQLTLFGYAINSDPKNLPAALLVGDRSPFVRSIVGAMSNTQYFQFISEAQSRQEADGMLARGDVQFVVSIPENFTHDLMRGDRPQILVEADATDPVATVNAIAALRGVIQTALANDLKGPVARLNPAPAPVDLRIHAKYNPEAISQYNIVPGLMGVVLTMTMIIITSLAITRERERGTMENLLSTPARPFEVMTGKIVPYIIVGFIQVSLILVAAKFLFHVPMLGNVFLLYAVALIFIVANLAMGILFSTVARNQLQAVQMSFFFFLPSLLLSGFMFPFRGMPTWAQWIGEAFPLTHFLRIVRGILLKANGPYEVSLQLWQLLLFMAVVMTVALKRYRQTLD